MTDQEANYFTGQPGTRLPHLWLDEQHQQSTLDWLEGTCMLVTSGRTTDWGSVITPVSRATGLCLMVRGFAP